MFTPKTFFIIGCSWYVTEFFLQSLLVRNPSRNDRRKLLLLSWLSDILGIVIGFLYYSLNLELLGSFSSITASIGIILILIGAIIRWISIFTLKKYFTVTLNVTKEQKIIDYGIYKYVRHPSYSGILLSHIGLGLIFCNVVSFAFLTIPLSIWIIQRIQIEEKMLIESFKNEYTDYIKKTKRLIPFIL